MYLFHKCLVRFFLFDQSKQTNKQTKKGGAKSAETKAEKKKQPTVKKKKKKKKVHQSPQTSKQNHLQPKSHWCTIEQPINRIICSENDVGVQ